MQKAFLIILIRLADKTEYQDPIPSKETTAIEKDEKFLRESIVNNIPIKNPLLKITKKPFGIEIIPHPSLSNQENFRDFTLEQILKFLKMKLMSILKHDQFVIGELSKKRQ